MEKNSQFMEEDDKGNVAKEKSKRRVLLVECKEIGGKERRLG